MNIKIGSRIVGDDCPVFIIAEAGSNHDGKLEQAYKLIDIAALAGVDAIKFQVFTADKIYPRIETRVEYLKKLGVDKPIYQIIKESEMPLHWLPLLSLYCKKKGIIFLATPFDEDSADALNPHINAYKIASYEITHIPLLRHIAKKGKPVILSTGASSLAEVAKAVSVIKSEGNKQIVVLQCTAKYPAVEMNLRTIKTMREELGVLTGLSDHSRSPIISPIIATALGAVVIEKHFTISNKLEGADHKFALEPLELKLMTQVIRDTTKMMGSGTKSVLAEEQELAGYRRTIFTIKDVKVGEEFSKENICVLRKPGMIKEGLAPEMLNVLLGKKATKNLCANIIVQKGDF